MCLHCLAMILYDIITSQRDLIISQRDLVISQRDLIKLQRDPNKIHVQLTHKTSHIRSPQLCVHIILKVMQRSHRGHEEVRKGQTKVPKVTQNSFKGHTTTSPHGAIAVHQDKGFSVLLQSGVCAVVWCGVVWCAVLWCNLV